MRFKKILFVWLSLHMALLSNAIDEVKNSRIEGANINTGKTVSVKDDKFPGIFVSGWNSGFSFMKNKGTVEFGLDESKRMFYNSDFSVDITFDVTATDRFNNQQVFTGKTLSINYKQSGSYTDKAQLVFDGYVKLDVTITSVNAKTLPAGTSMPLPGELYLEAEIATSRRYPFYPRQAPASAASNINHHVISCGLTTGELEIYWEYVPGAEEYELEWTWVNDYAGSALEYDFKFDATRIVTKNTYYRIPLLYEKGYILYRLRHIGRGGTSFTQRVEGVWTIYPERGLVSSYPANMKYYVGAYSTDGINWASTMTFDENARKGSGVSFMDGMLMGRQSIAKLNTEIKTISQSVIYDYQGRPAISILPVPINGECLVYQNGMNRNNANTVYNAADFDKDGTGPCAVVTGSLNVNTGASNYYSSSNSNKEGAQGYLPIADGLPFVQVEYTNDMTGRIKSQTMPGEVHQLGKGKETKFSYSNPGDEELLYLFGSEAGHVSHYDKNIVIDANGQQSASYRDMQGRVIATSLLGPKPANVDGIEDYNSSVRITDNMAAYNMQDRNDYSISSVKGIYIENANSVQSFVYEFMPEDIQDNCAPNLCFDCIYELEFRITDDCNTDVIPPVTTIVGNVSVANAILDDCDQPSVKYELSPGTPLQVTFPKTGNYRVSKTLKVSDKNLDLYIQRYMTANTCIPSYRTILQAQINDIDMSNCNMDCQSCSTSVAAYAINYPLTHNGAPIPTDELRHLYNECSTLCIESVDPCFTARQAMLQDFHPGGQYAGYTIDPVTGNYNVANKTSILYGANALGIYYTDCSLNYVDANGNGNVKVDIFRNGQLLQLPVCALTAKEFIDNFQPSWAQAFLNYHPESCYLTFCEDNKTSDQYDYGMLETNTYDEAYAKGYLKPLSGMSLPACPGTGAAGNYDPFFTTLAGGISTINQYLLSSGFSTYKNLMDDYMSAYPDLTLGSGNIYDIAKTIARNDPSLTSGFGCEPCTKDKEWIMFRNLYLNLKLRLYSQAKTDFVIYNGCFNGCMQGSGLQGGSGGQPFTPSHGNITPPYTMLYFLQGNSFGFSYTAPSPFYEFYTLSGYPIAQSPTVPGYVKVHDGFFQGQITGPNPCSASGAGEFNTKIARFQQLPFSVDATADFYQNLLTHSPSGPSVIPSSPTASPATANLYCQNTCESYADAWIDKLKNCNPAFDISNSAYNLTLVDMVKNGLIEVCVKGCDKDNPFGASTVNPGLADPATGPGYFDSFEEVLTYYASHHPGYFFPNANGECSYLNLDFPEPYGHDYGTAGSAATGNKLDTCGCNKVLDTEMKFAQLQGDNTLPQGVTTIEQYFNYLYNTSIVNFNELACKCRSVSGNSWYPKYEWSQPQSESLLGSDIGIPDVLACSRCLSCTTVVAAIKHFNATNPGWSNSPLHDKLMENSLNASLNMNLQASDYLAFYNSCTDSSQPASSCNASSVRAQIVAFVNTYIALLQAQPVTGPVSLTLSNSAYPGLFGSCLFPCSDDGNLPTMLTLNVGYTPPYTYEGVAYPGKLHYNTPSFHYYNGKGVCSQFDCDPHFDIIDQAFDPNIIDYTVTHVVFSNALSGFNMYLEGTYNDSNGPHTFGNGYPLFNYPCLNPEYLNPSGEPQLCNEPYNPTGTAYNDCYSSMLNQAETNAKLIYQWYVDKYTADFKKAYKEKCVKVQETYKRTYDLNEYHYTLYYYDQAGNLTRTVPPKGVQKLTPSQVAQLKTATPSAIYPSHTYVTNYKYQSYGAPVTSKTPDEDDLTDYAYDNIGRIQLSCNARQKTLGQFSYTLYDELGRIAEVGVLSNLPSGYNLASFRTAIANNTFEAFVNAPLSPTIKTEVIKTYYDRPLNTTISGQFDNGQLNLRNRVATVIYEDTDDFNSATYTYASHYTYDEHGNVGRVIQDVPALSVFARQFYKMDYEYDLISGNVNKVTYQPGREDQFMHKYEYDADNRLHRVYTSRDNINWDRDAKYFYYEHGPLARTELGDAQVQGTDFAYTIHGWIKAVNSNILEAATDMGKDGARGNAYQSAYSNIHQYTAMDAAGYSLNYYQQGGRKDYTAIKTFSGIFNKDLIASTANVLSSGSFNLAADAPDLYNGNISSMVTSIYDIDQNSNNTHAENTVFPQITGYRYDQLHRLTQMKAFRSISLSNNAWNVSTAGAYDGSYYTSLSYDKNGNIMQQRRDGAAFMTGQGLAMDNMTYVPDNTGILPNNKLMGVNDSGGGTYTNDIKDATTPVNPNSSATFEYTYDEVGSLKKDKKECIAAIEWTVDRKVKKVIRDAAGLIAANENMPDLEFQYDANRQRIVKIVKPRDQASRVPLDQSHWIYTYYVRDASGNISATYEKSFAPVSGQAGTYTETLKLQEHEMYGSSRLGVIPAHQVMGSSNVFTAAISGNLFTNVSYISGQPRVSPLGCTLSNLEPVACAANYDRKLGDKRFELTNHLGNVLTVISDRKIAVADPATCKTCAEIQTIYANFISANGPLHNGNLNMFTSYANTAFSLSETSATYLQALKDCGLITNTIDFAGNGYVSNTAGSAGLNLGTGNVSVEAWFKCANNSNYKMLIDNMEWGSLLRGIQVCVYQDKLYAAFFEGNTLNSWHVYTSNSIPANQWTHAVITKTGYNPASYAIYINGVAVPVVQAPAAGSTGVAGMNTSGPLNLAMNIYAGSPSSFFTGRLKNMKIYNKALSPSEIAFNYNGGCMTDNTVQSNLVYYARLNEGGGTSAYDDSGNNLTSIITNGPWTFDAVAGSGCLTLTDLAKRLCYFTSTTSSNAIAYYKPEILETHDYYAFGMEMPGRSVGSDYKYGMNGQMKEGETFEGAYSADYWTYDSRLGRRWERDPITYPWQSPYATFNNNSIYYADPHGLEGGPAKPDFNFDISETNGGGDKGKNGPPQPQNGQKFRIVQRDFENVFDKVSDKIEKSQRYTVYGNNQYYSYAKDNETNTTYVENIFNFNTGEAGKQYYSFQGDWDDDSRIEDGDTPRPTGRDRPTSRGITPTPIIYPILTPRRIRRPQFTPPIVPPPTVPPPLQIPCMPISQVANLLWVGGQPVLQNPTADNATLTNMTATWQQCHTQLIITINTPFNGVNRDVPNSQWFNWAPSAVMQARANVILGRLSISRRLPASVIRNAQVIINYNQTGTQNGIIQFRLWDPDNGVIYIINIKGGLW